MDWTPGLALQFALITMLPGFAISALATWWIRSRADRWGLVDQPGVRKVHTNPTPLGGGLGIWLGLVVPLALGHGAVWLIARSVTGPEQLPEFLRFAWPHLAGFQTKAGDLWAILGLGTLLVLVGLWDDRKGLAWQVRLGVQFGVAAVVVWGLGWKLSLFMPIPLLPELLTLLWIVGLINSFNMLDNMDGLSAGVATIASLMLATVLLLAPDPITQGPQLFIAGFLFVLVGSTLGFLWHNRPPAKIFMGDSGSYLIGFCMAVMTVVATFAGTEVQRQHAILAPLFILAVPLYDMTTVLWIRLREGRSPFQPDKCHFSHRLVELGFTKPQAVLVIYLLTGTCGLGALILHRVDRLGAVFITLLVLSVLALIAMLESAARRRVKQTET
ncbi:MAG: MraY family glycosyltransferase [Pirellulaceae bacterium]